MDSDDWNDVGDDLADVAFWGDWPFKALLLLTVLWLFVGVIVSLKSSAEADACKAACHERDWRLIRPRDEGRLECECKFGDGWVKADDWRRL